MEFAKLEVSAVSEAARKVDELVMELTDLEMVLVGGGTGDVHFG